MDRLTYQNALGVAGPQKSKAPENLRHESCGFDRVDVSVRSGRPLKSSPNLAKDSADKGRTLLIVDVSNIYCCVGRCFDGRKVDYSKLLEKVRTEFGNNVKAVAYGTDVGGNDSYFMRALERLGFELKFRKPRTYDADGRGIVKGKANLDVEIAVDITSSTKNYDRIILLSADGDFAPCLEYAKKMNKKTKVIGCRISKALKAISEWEEITEALLE